jgi:1,4-alpha-glucan branching enzyme
MYPTIDREIVDQLAANLYADPFFILGVHDSIVRTYQPWASAVWVVDPENTLYPMHESYPGFFEWVAPEPSVFAYQLKILEKEGAVRLIYDPYAFSQQQCSALDMHLFGEGNHHRLWEKLGAHPVTYGGISGTHFSVWAPGARNVSVLSNCNRWDGRVHQMRRLEGMGIWEIFIPGLSPGEIYKYEIKNSEGHIYEKADPFAFQQELRPRTGSVVTDLNLYTWNDANWLERRRSVDPLRQPIAVYEVHLGSWKRAEEDRMLTYRELADDLIPYVQELGFTHIELLPILEHPFDGSWGYQVLGYYAPTSRFGSQDDFRYFVDRCHQAGIGVLLDWVPAHFPKDAAGLAHFDGTSLFEHADPRQGEHKEWGTLVFNYGRNEIRNFLTANALFWFEEYHIDGIRVDAVAAMLYLNYSREDGEWVANKYGGAENLEAITFLQQLNALIFEYYPGALTIAEESTSWPLVSRPTYLGGLGFNLKWNMGWMHDTLHYFKESPEHRPYHQNEITFSITYAFFENFVLAFSHDEVVHMKGSMPGKMPGDAWQKFANLRALYTYMYGHPGKKTIFMGMEFGQWAEWNFSQSLDWHLIDSWPNKELLRFVGDLNKLYKTESAFWDDDFTPAGFQWINCNDRQNSVFSFLRRSKETGEYLIFVCNFTPTFHRHYRVGVPQGGYYAELLNSDSAIYGGSNQGNMGGLYSNPWPLHDQPHSLGLHIPPLGCLVLKWQPEEPEPPKALS